MIVSMTGFSSTILALPKPISENDQKGIIHHVHLAMSLKTLNSRFFELNCKLPYSLSFLETDLIKYFKSKLYRGTITFSIHMSDSSALTGTIAPSLPAVRGYLSSIERIKELFDVSGTVSIDSLIALPNVFETHETPLDPQIIDQIMKAIEGITEKCQATRIKEGEVLAKDLQNRIEVIKGHMHTLEPRALVVWEQKRDQLFANLKAVLDETHKELAPELQNNVIYNQLEKIDIHEEIVRFKAHLDNLSAAINSPEIETGKKLDFTLQELFREINTIASKCSDAHISHLAINIKVELEKAREQAQNIV